MGRLREFGNRRIKVYPALDGDLEDKEDTEDFVTDAGFRFPDFLGEDVAQAPDTLGELIVRAGEVEDGEGGGVDG